MSKIEVDAIDKQSGSTLTLGGSGTAVTLACGATQSGFGATGGISWQTAIKTTDFTAVSGEGYFVNTSGGSDITVTLPASPSAGNVVAIKDYARTFGTNAVIAARNGSNMDGTANNTSLATDGLSVTFVFMDSTKGWSLINDDTTTVSGAGFIAATGGTVTTVCTNFKVHTFTGPGTFQVTDAGNAGGSNTVDYLVIAGGGGGGGNVSHGGGAGAGGYRESGGTASGCYTVSPLGSSPSPVAALPVTATSYSIAVGGGGARSASGAVSTFSTITSAGGGNGANPGAAVTGGSGGGALCNGTPGAAGNTPPTTPPQGQPGGGGNYSSPHYGTGGGGGAGAAGAVGTPGAGGAGGNGATSSINGTPTTRAGGGGGSSYQGGGPNPGGTGGGGAGTIGGPAPNATNAVAGTANTGGGGGGGERCVPSAGGAAGGSGIVIIRYKFQ